MARLQTSGPWQSRLLVGARAVGLVAPHEAADLVARVVVEARACRACRCRRCAVGHEAEIDRAALAGVVLGARIGDQRIERERPLRSAAGGRRRRRWRWRHRLPTPDAVAQRCQPSSFCSTSFASAQLSKAAALRRIRAAAAPSGSPAFGGGVGKHRLALRCEAFRDDGELLAGSAASSWRRRALRRRQLAQDRPRRPRGPPARSRLRLRAARRSRPRRPRRARRTGSPGASQCSSQTTR